MQVNELSLEQLTTILMTAKASEGKSIKTSAWYERTLGDYCGWLTRAGLPETLGAFTLERVRAYIVDLQQRAAFERHPTLPTRAHRLADASVNSYLRALRAFSNWLYAEGYTIEHTLARLKAPRLAKTVKVILTPEERSTRRGMFTSALRVLGRHAVRLRGRRCTTHALLILVERQPPPYERRCHDRALRTGMACSSHSRARPALV